MLSPPTPFPYVGSYCLIEHEGRDQLARILQRAWFNGGAHALVSFPLRDGAGGNLWVAEPALVDGTALSREEEREFHDLDRALAGRSLRTAKQKAMVGRRDALRQRLICHPLLKRLFGALEAREAARRAA